MIRHPSIGISELCKNKQGITNLSLVDLNNNDEKMNKYTYFVHKLNVQLSVTN